MRTVASVAVTCAFLLPASSVRGEGPEQRVNSRGVYAYYDAEQALQMAGITGRPIFVLSVRGNDCAGGL